MIRHVLCLLFAVFFLGSAASAADAPPPAAGRVRLVEGDVSVLRKSQPLQRPNVGDGVQAGDTLITGRDGEIHLEMADSGYLALRPNTRLVIADYRARGDKDDRSILRLLQGTFRSITGWLPKVAPRNYRIETITATIGVRGTDHEPLFLPDGSPLGEPGTYDKVNEGATYMEHSDGRLDIVKNAVGFTPFGKRTKARLLERIPEFFRPTRNEDLLSNRHEAIQRKLDEKLEERRRLERDPANRDLEPRDGAADGLQKLPGTSLPGGGGGGGVGGAAIAPAAVLPALPGGGGVPGAGVTSVPVPGVPVPPLPVVVPDLLPDIPLPSLPGGAAPPAPPAEEPAALPPAAPESKEAPAAARPGGAAPGTTPSTGRAAPPVVQPATEDRAKLQQERRRRALEDPQAQYERDRQNLLERDTRQGRDAERDAVRRKRDQR